LGSLQGILGAYQYKFSFYVIGLMMAFGLMFGRFVCGFLCPFGLIQELLHRVPFLKYMRENPLTRRLRAVKYVLLAVFVIGLPLLFRNEMGLGDPAFCKYICPAGTLFGGAPLLVANPPLREAAGTLFVLKSTIAIAVVTACLSIYRAFCKFLCPLGAFYAMFGKISLYRLHLCESDCVHCGKCAEICKMGVNPSKEPDSHECIRCGDCVKACPAKALRAGFELCAKSEPKAGRSTGVRL
jgi:polyferredoxin